MAAIGTLLRLRRNLGLDRESACVAVGSVALGSYGILPTEIAVAVAIAGTLLIFHALRLLAHAERISQRMSLDNPPSRLSLVAALQLIAERLDLIGHRSIERHPTTGLGTREHLFARMTEDLANPPAPRLLGAIRFVDFGRIAAFDQPAADEALTAIAERLEAATRVEHTIAQIDRDCFAIWFSGGGDIEMAVAELRAITFVAAQDIAGSLSIVPTIEVGMAAYPEDGTEADRLLVRAVSTLALCNRATSNTLALSCPSAAGEARDRFVLEQDIGRAIQSDQLNMAFQPVVDVARGQLIGAEALLRWDHPVLGRVSPARFIPIVEAIGLSDTYGLWVLNAACREARRWQDAGLVGVKVAVNLSARQLHDPTLTMKIRRTLDRHRITARALELELTETAAMADPERTGALFAELRSIGISLAIDDFGAGYSSLSYLKNLPFDKLKIDREFVTDVHQRKDSRAICRALIELGRGLDLLVLAEGVELGEEVSCLSELGCTIFQGYHFSRPLTGQEFLARVCNSGWLSTLSSRQGRLSA